jgi:hypothetical protein
MGVTHFMRLADAPATRPKAFKAFGQTPWRPWRWARLLGMKVMGL